MIGQSFVFGAIVSSVELATVVTNNATSVSGTSMTLNGNITDLGGGTATSHGFYFGTNSNYASNTKYNLGTKASTGTFNTTRTGLSSSTTYYFTAFVVNEAGESVGSTVSQATSWVAQSAAISTSSYMRNTNFDPGGAYSNHVHFYQINYSGIWYDTYNSTGTYFNGIRYYGSHGPTTTTVYTNTNNRLTFGIEGTGTDSSGSVRLRVIRTGSRTFSNYSSATGFGGGSVSTSNSSTALDATNTISSAQSIAYIQHQFRYS